MSPSPHLQAAATLLDRASEDEHGSAPEWYHVAAAQAHALVACAEALGEITARLDTQPRPVKQLSDAQQAEAAAALIERLAVRSSGQHREGVIARLVGHRQQPYLLAAPLVHDALLAAAQTGDDRLSARVQQAAALLGIEVPE